MSDQIVNFKYASTVEGKVVKEDDFVVTNRGFMADAPEHAKLFGSSYKGNMIVGTTEADKLRITSDIIVAGGAVNAQGVFENNVIPTGMSVEEILRKLLCVEKWPDAVSSTKGTASASVANPTITANVTKNSTVKYGASITFNAITAKSVSYTFIPSAVTGLTWGYGEDLTSPASTSTSITQNWSTEETGATSLSATVSGFSALTNTTGSTLAQQTVTADALGTNTLTVKTTSGKCKAVLPSIPQYYMVSNMGNRDANHKTPAVDSGTYEVASVTNSVSYSVTAVYPVFTNISNKTLTTAVNTEMTLSNSTTFLVDFPSEMGITPYASFAYPANRTLTVDIKQIDGSYKSYAGTSTDVAEETTRSINGKDVQYNVWTRTGTDKLGANSYKFTLSKATSVA